MNVIVNISDAKTSSEPSDTLVTYALGSCIGVAAYDATARVGGLLHFQLPTSTIDPQKAVSAPLMFADTGLECLLREMERQGAMRKRTKIKLAGAAQMLNDDKIFNIGRRNHAAIRKLLWQQGLFIEAEQIGGGSPRNLYLAIADGSVHIRSGVREERL